MYNIHPAHNDTTTPFEAHANNDQGARLNWLILWNADAERHARLFRNGREAEQLRLMRRPIATGEAFARFGLLLGAFVPAALFYRMFDYGIGTRGSDVELLPVPLFLLAMNVICCLMGRFMGSVIGRKIDSYERGSWNLMLAYSTCVGALWGVVTGAAGGILFFVIGALCGALVAFFVIGALYGALVALPVGMLGFALFTPLHRLMARGGMIDARHFWPLACGVVFSITALILSPNLYPY